MSKFKKKSPKTPRTVAYILGAGFSYGTKHCAYHGKASVEMPTQKTLFEILCKFNSKKMDRLKNISKFIRRYFNPESHRTKRKPGYKQHKDLFGLSVEEIVTFMQELIDTEAPDGKWAEMLSQDFLILTAELISHLSNNGPIGNNPCLKKFVKNKVQKTDVIVTFNWDTLLDRVLEKQFKKTNWKRNFGYGNTITSAMTNLKSVTIPHNHPKLFKLHGSINWKKNGKKNLEITKKWALDSDYKKAFMMPPKMVKNEIFVKDSLYRQIWQEAEERLEKCKKIVFIGYSFPAADYAVTSMLRRIISAIKKLKGRKPPKIVIVDPRVESLSAQFYSSFRLEVKPEDRYLSISSFLAEDR